MITDLQELDLEVCDEISRYGYSSEELGNMKDYLRRVRDGEAQRHEYTVTKFTIVLFGTRGDMIAHWLKRFRTLKSASDELPPELVQGNYKCRGNFVVGMKASLSRLIKDGIELDDETMSKIKEFFDYEFDFARRTTREEIVFINQTLDVTLNDLERLEKEEADENPE